MSLSRKSSRALVVDGVAYRWLIRHKPTYMDILDWNSALLRVAIEQENARGATLIVTSDQIRLAQRGVGVEAGVIRPSDIARWIREARADGWDPATPGSALHRLGKTTPPHDVQDL